MDGKNINTYGLYPTRIDIKNVHLQPVDGFRGYILLSPLQLCHRQIKHYPCNQLNNNYLATTHRIGTHTLQSSYPKD